jgi:hypothetical protein
MRTVRLSDEDFAEVHAAMTAAMDGQDVLLEVLAARFGPDSDLVKVERARLASMEEADRSLRGVSSWRSGGDKNPRRSKRTVS